MKNLLYLTIFLVFSCNAPIKPAPQPDRYLHIKDVQARDIIRASIENAGSIEQWEAIKKLRYTKDYKLWLESGEEEAAYQEIHEYHFDSMKIDIQSRENGGLIHTHLENGQYSRTKDGLAVDSPPAALEKAINTSTYVRVGGILFNQKRQSFRVDSLGNKLYLRAEYWYDNYQVE